MKAKATKTPTEWQEAVDAAEFYLLLHSAIAYGLVTGPKVDVDRCEELLRCGKAMGFRPLSHQQLIKKYLGCPR